MQKTLEDLMQMAISLELDSVDHRDWVNNIPPTEDDIVLGDVRYSAYSDCDDQAIYGLPKKVKKELTIRESDSIEILHYKLQKLKLSDLEERFLKIVFNQDLSQFKWNLFLGTIKDQFDRYEKRREKNNPDHPKPELNDDKPISNEDLLVRMTELLG